ncbi:MAG: type II toxin-antitoxin system VapC family toxin [Candidatus Margulisiibacteriota bacterium]|nr:type II toxin-antitoxin system VapC family toxin [Candidatus Margulisiibacteriota bacterium]
MKTLVDSCGWLEYFTEGKLAEKYYAYLRRFHNIITPTMVVYEVYKKIKKERGEEEALLAAAQIEETEIVPLTHSTALLAADVSLEHKIPMADAMIYATARIHSARLVTSDEHLENLENVVYLKK